MEGARGTMAVDWEERKQFNCPDVASRRTTPIEIGEGVTMAVETMHPADCQDVHVEEMGVVREKGIEILSEWPVEEITRVDY